jgi:4-aminobutyrate aminotransferase-like enzyme
MSVLIEQTQLAHLARNAQPRRTWVSVTGGSGALFRDVSGRQYIDLSSQTVNLLFGQVHPYITEQVIARLREYTFFDQDLDCAADRDAVALLHALLPAELTAINIKMCNGSDAVESAVKQARRATGNSLVLTVEGIYLGQSTQAINLRGLGPRPADIVRGSAEQVIFAPRPYCPAEDHNALTCPIENGEAICELVDRHRGNLACVLLDPLMMTSGVVGGRAMSVMIQRVREHTQILGIPLILDECQTFGWVPDYTLARHWDVVPDAMALAKGVGGGFPLGVCASREGLDNLEWGEADFTSGGHPASIAGLAATCTLLADELEQMNFDVLTDALDQLLAGDWRGTARTRGIGLIRAVEVLDGGRPADPALVRRISDRCMARGVHVRPCRSVLGIKPPRVISIDQLEQAVEVVRSVIANEV